MTWDDVRTVQDEAEHVTKFVFTKPDAVAEAVLYRYPDYETRTVICCSSQSGCPVGCRFCGAGDSFVRSLRADEIVSQVEWCMNEAGVPWGYMDRLQIMFMSMGEPLLNMRAMSEAIRRLHGMYPNAALLVSTSGPRVNYEPFRDLSSAIKTVGLQFSVHESTDAAREKLIPFKHKLTLQGIADEGVRWAGATGRHPYFNYCAHENNTSEEGADRLLKLFCPSIWRATVSVVCERDEHVASKNERQRALALDFGSMLMERGFDVRVFDPAGQDTIGGGCGQLWFVQEWMRENPHKSRPSCGSGIATMHPPRDQETETA